jgi:hypothetical protein
MNKLRLPINVLYIQPLTLITARGYFPNLPVTRSVKTVKKLPDASCNLAPTLIIPTPAYRPRNFFFFFFFLSYPIYLMMDECFFLYSYSSANDRGKITVVSRLWLFICIHLLALRELSDIKAYFGTYIWIRKTQNICCTLRSLI